MTTLSDKWQYMHSNSYGRKVGKMRRKNGHRSAAEIVAEMIREPYASPHVTNPLPPEILEGDPVQALNIANEMAGRARDALGRKLRVDAHVIAVCVCSYPVPNAELREPADIAERDRWVESSLDWARQTFGADCIKAAVLHLDEGYPHLHIVLIPPAPGVEPCPLRRAAKSAAAKAKGQQRPRRIERNAFKQAARDFQDSFYRAVSCKFGHERIGTSRRKRMSPEQRHLEKTQARALMHAQNEAKLLVQQTTESLRRMGEAAARRIAGTQKELDAKEAALHQKRMAWQLEKATRDAQDFRQLEELREKAARIGKRLKPTIDQMLSDTLAQVPAATRRLIEPIIMAIRQRWESLLESGRWTEGITERIDAAATRAPQLQGWSIPRR